MSGFAQLRTLNLIAVLALVIAIGSLFYGGSTCKIANGATICDVGDTETIEDAVTLQDELIVGATPSAGNAGEFLVSGGADNPPEWVAGIAPTYVLKTTIETTQNDTTLSDDAELVFPAESLSTYIVRGVFIVVGDSTADIKFALNGSFLGVEGVIWNPTSGSNASVLFNGASTTLQTATTSGDAFPFEFIIETSALGDIAIQWAQNTSDAAFIGLDEGSYLSYAKID